MNVFEITFSPTGGTKQVCDELIKVWNKEVHSIDLLKRNVDTSIEFHEDDICYIAVPSYGGRVPATALERLTKMKGNHALAVLIVVYGNRAYDDTLLELNNTMLSLGFRCKAAVCANAQHSIMSQFGAGRPDEEDKKQLSEYANKIYETIMKAEGNVELQIPGNIPYREYHGVPMKPSANKKCNACGLCAKQCPVKAIPLDHPSITNNDVCISCMHCISICPQHARSLNKIMLLAASTKMKKACSGRKENELFL